jgi:hypothetical protein
VCVSLCLVHFSSETHYQGWEHSPACSFEQEADVPDYVHRIVIFSLYYECITVTLYTS